MDLSQRALQTNGKLFFQISNSFTNFWLKTEIFSKEYQGVNIDQIAMCCISMDSSQQALQTNGKLFSNFELVFEFFSRKPKFFQKNREAWIMIKLQCVVFQWIRLNELYKLMESFISN